MRAPSPRPGGQMGGVLDPWLRQRGVWGNAGKVVLHELVYLRPNFLFHQSIELIASSILWDEDGRGSKRKAINFRHSS